MGIEQWQYYNHAAIPKTPPHIDPDISPIENGEVWKMGGRPLLARWTTDFDCKYNTGWWYIIKDTPFNIDCLKSNERYKINKGNKYFYVKAINPLEHLLPLYNVLLSAVKSYPKKNRYISQFSDFKKYMQKLSNSNTKVYAAFFKEDDELCGYLVCDYFDSYFSLTSQKANPIYEKYQINAALVYAMLIDNKELLSKGIYCVDGARNINHETHFQDYLEKYFGFHKVFCKLHIFYNHKIQFIIKIVFPIRRILRKFDGIKFVHLVNSIFLMEEITRGDK